MPQQKAGRDLTEVAEIEEHKYEIETVYKVYESLQNVFSSRDHLIVGREAEEQSIKGFI